MGYRVFILPCVLNPPVLACPPFPSFQILLFCEFMRRQRGLSRDSEEFAALRWRVIYLCAGAGAVVLACLLQMDFFGPLSIRVRGLFVEHTKTGNPLVDSVAEHQPATKSAYWQYLHYMCAFAPLGWVGCMWRPTPAKLFVLLWGALGYFFSLKMNRLIILLGPVTSALAGVALGGGFDWCVAQLSLIGGLEKGSSEGKGSSSEGASSEKDDSKESSEAAKEATPASSKGGRGGKGSSGKGSKGKASSSDRVLPQEVEILAAEVSRAYRSTGGRVVRIAAALLLLLGTPLYLNSFYQFCHMFAQATSQPSIVFQAQLNSGERIIVNDYLDCYNWLRENTPEDSRVMSWWDYGYQITGIANRTTLADGNTWNLEHISLIARCLTSPEKRAHSIIRHLADYVLVWSGGGGDDLAKLPHIARIGNSVYPDICPNDPLCRTFGFYDQQRTPMPRTKASVVYKLVEGGVRPGVEVNPELFREVYKSKYGKVRVYQVQRVSKKSKKWLADPANRLCDAPGSWYCPGQYPPDLPERIGESHANLDYKAHGHDHKQQ